MAELFLIVAVAANGTIGRDGRLPWRKLVPSLTLIVFGIACVNAVELELLLGS